MAELNVYHNQVLNSYFSHTLTQPKEYRHEVKPHHVSPNQILKLPSSIVNTRKLCGTIFCHHAVSAFSHQMCMAAKCNLHPHGRDHQTNDKNDPEDSLTPRMKLSQRLKQLKISMAKPYGHFVCSIASGISYLQHFAHNCFGLHPQLSQFLRHGSGQQNPILSGKEDESELKSFKRRRRLASISAQCIESHCSGKRGTSRQFCIMQYCN